tara:strand:+ start:419 stop:541 length:123 start_codon:yes stop_codon:yes gene_type:complete
MKTESQKNRLHRLNINLREAIGTKYEDEAWKDLNDFNKQK